MIAVYDSGIDAAVAAALTKPVSLRQSIILSAALQLTCASTNHSKVAQLPVAAYRRHPCCSNLRLVSGYFWLSRDLTGSSSVVYTHKEEPSHTS